MKKGCKIVYSKPIGLTSRDIVLASIYVFGYKIMRYSRNRITSEEELDIEVEHYQFLKKYNLL